MKESLLLWTEMQKQNYFLSFKEKLKKVGADNKLYFHKVSRVCVCVCLYISMSDRVCDTERCSPLCSFHLRVEPSNKAA